MPLFNRRSSSSGAGYPDSETTFNATGANQTYAVPGTVGRIRFAMWGGAGGSNGGAASGAGGWTEGEIIVTSGETINVRVGEGGQRGGVGPATFAYPNGGKGSNSGGGFTGTSRGGDGGGRCEIARGATTLAAAGGGGASSTSYAGGAGGGSTGVAGADGSGTGGAGGSQVAGGSNGGASLVGGNADGVYCGGGGDGYFGGGGGVTNRAGGGGGSGYIGGCVADSSEEVTAVTTAGSGVTTPQTGHAKYPGSVGNGNSSSADGEDGYIVIY